MGIVNFITNRKFIQDAIQKAALIQVDKIADELTFRSIDDPNRQWREDEFKPANKTDLMRTYERHVWVYSSIYATATAIAQIPIRIWKLKPNDERGEEVTRGDMWELIYKPNPYMRYFEFIESWVSYALLTGNNYIEKSSPVNPEQLWILRPDFVTIKTGSKKLIEGYIYEPDGMSKTILAANEVIHFRFWHPRSEIYGFSFPEAVQTSLILDFNAIKYQKNFFKQGGAVNLYLKVKEKLGNIEFKRQKEELRSEYAGVDRQHLPMLVDNDGELKSAGIAPDKILLGEQRTLNRDEILSAGGTPPIMVNLLGGKETYNNARTQERVFWINTAKPIMKRIANTLNSELYWPRNHEVEFDLSGIEALQEDEKAKAQTANIYVKGGIMTPNEARAKYLNMKEHPDGNNLQLKPEVGVFGRDDTAIKKAKKRFTIEDVKKEWKKLNDRYQDITFYGIVSVFRKLEKIVLNNVRRQMGKKLIKQDIASGAFSGVGDIMDDLKDDLVLTNTLVATGFGATTYRRLTGGAFTDEVRKTLLKAIDKHVVTWAKKSRDSIIKTMKGNVQDFLKTAVKEEQNITDITRGIQELFRGKIDPEVPISRAKFPHARMIARTETGLAGDFGKFEVTKIAGFKKKRWIWSGLSREDHGRFDAEGVKDLDYVYVSKNGPILHPHDPNADVSHLANCACTFLEVAE